MFIYWLFGGLLATALMAFLLWKMLIAAAGRRPETDTDAREQVIAQMAAFSGQKRKAGDQAWDGVNRTKGPTDPGT